MKTKTITDFKEKGDLKEVRNDFQMKENFYSESYSSHHLKREQRFLWAQLRSGTLPLPTEVGKYKGIPKEQRM